MASTSMSTTARSTATSSACARSSRTPTTILRRSKPSMASVTDTATAKPAARRAEKRPDPARRRRLRWPSLSPLTRRIVAVNVLPLALLAVGFLYLGKFEASLIGQQIESLHTQGEIFAAALSEGAVLDSVDAGGVLLPDLARQMLRRLVEPTRTRARLFDGKGKLIADSRLLRGPGDVKVADLPAERRKGLLVRLAD